MLSSGPINNEISYVPKKKKNKYSRVYECTKRLHLKYSKTKMMLHPNVEVTLMTVNKNNFQYNMIIL